MMHSVPSRQKLEQSSILYIEDDAITRRNLSQFLKPQCKVLYTAEDGKEGLNLFDQHDPDIVITDIEMPGFSGLDVAKKIRESSLSTQIIIITAYTKPEYLMEAVNLQLVQYLIKPINLDKMVNVLEFATNYLEEKNPGTKYMLRNDTFYDVYTKELVSNERIINLSKYERRLVELLIDKHPAPVSYDLIDAHIYDYGASKNAIKLLVSSLREKILKESISNVPGFGYKLNLLDEI